MTAAHRTARGDRSGWGSSTGAPATMHLHAGHSVVTGDRRHDPGRTIMVTGARGGQGTTTVAAGLALYAAEAGEVALVTAEDTATRALLGVPAVEGEPTLAGGSLTLVSAPAIPLPATTVVDAGRLGSGHPAVGEAEHYVVLRGPCYVALATLVASDGPRPHGIILVAEDGRSLTARDVEEVTGLPVVATVQASPRVARTIDAGLLASRLPRLRELAALRRIAMPDRSARPQPTITQPCPSAR